MITRTYYWDECWPLETKKQFNLRIKRHDELIILYNNMIYIEYKKWEQMSTKII